MKLTTLLLIEIVFALGLTFAVMDITSSFRLPSILTAAFIAGAGNALLGKYL
jgi:hypothetical protein